MKIAESVYRSMNAVPFSKVKIEDELWRPRMKANQTATLKACLEQCERTGRIANFAKAARRMNGEHEGIYFNDSDVYKVLEGVAYSLMNEPNAELEAEADRIIDLIAAAQEEDGYLMTYFTLKAPESKWTDMEKHEMYCGGHLMEAAVAYFEATGKRTLLDVACRLADYYDERFGPGQAERHWVEGHEEVELALVKLAQATGEEKYLRLAQHLLEERGRGYGKGAIWDRAEWGPAYCQDHMPVREQRTVVGHAVRAMYLYTGMADVAAITGDRGYMTALDSLWEHTVHRNMYVTGGIGPSRHNEGFTEDYDLPNETAYCETCASVGMVYWNHRMNLLHGDAKYVDVLERAMYNGALAGVSLSGDKFFYVNPLASQGKHHRVHWYDCSCCPTQLARFLPSVGNYVYAVSDGAVWVNLYVQGEGRIPLGEREIVLVQRTGYPWNGRVELVVGGDCGGKFALKLRIPGWVRNYTIRLNGEPVGAALPVKGYVHLEREWRQGDTVAIEFDMPVEKVIAHPKVIADEGRVALQRGPIVYCVEEADNKQPYDEIVLTHGGQFVVEHRKELLEGVTVIHGEDASGKAFQAVPYYAWDNREPGYMVVWMRLKEDTDVPLYRV
ncbi:glycoside hydrolase family 127 protein [Paenibacillus thermotolerans]|uniref:glycoside hydrolase family 127 protein n=1 Tax=Paenibacillus thermotolerans TaxID=3027807 RepID=UPI0023686F1B|nr:MULTISPECIES: beta-L-arabinofuranosidase domain-containing protein [unclassified Paenibacillus]